MTQPRFNEMFEKYNAALVDEESADNRRDILCRVLLAAAVIGLIVQLFFFVTFAASVAAKAVDQAQYDAAHFNEWVMK